MVAAAIIGAGAIAGASSMGSSAMGASAQGSASSKAREEQAKAAAQGREDIAAGVKTARADMQPYATVGGNALNDLALQMGLGGANAKAPMTSKQGKVQDPLWDSLLRKYNPKNAGMGTFSKTPAYAEAQKEYADTRQKEAEANPQYGALTKNYGMEQYKQDPGYTPMVNSLEELQSTPGYQFQLEQGLQSLGNSASARGSLLSGRQLKDINNYAQGQASTGYQGAWERAQRSYDAAFNRDTTNKNNTFNRLQGMAGQGQNAAGAQGNYSMVGGANMAGIAQNLGDTNAGLTLAQGQNTANMYTGIGNGINQIAGAGLAAYGGGGGTTTAGGGGGATNAPNISNSSNLSNSNYMNQNAFGFNNQKLNF